MNRQLGFACNSLAVTLPLILAAPFWWAQFNGAPSYQPRAVELPKDENYVLPDGSIYLAGDSELEILLFSFNKLFIKAHSEFRFTVMSKDTSSALGGLTAGVVAFALVNRTAWPLEVRPFRQLYGYEPTTIHIGRVGYLGAGRVHPPAIYVNARNPLRGLSVEQVARIFTAGGGKGDLATWGQLGLKGDWANRSIHVFGHRDDGGFATAMRHELMGGFPFTHRYEPLAKDADIINAVRDDPYGIGLIGFLDSRALPNTVRALPLAENSNESYSNGSYQDVFEGKYALTPYLQIYVNRVPGKPLDLVVKEYSRLLLSKEGQAIIAAQKSGKGCVPLNQREIAGELAKLE